MELKRTQIARRLWRMTTDAPLGEFIDFDPTGSAGRVGEASLKVLDPAPVVRASSFDLLNGVEVRDHSETIPSELFDRLFKR